MDRRQPLVPRRYHRIAYVAGVVAGLVGLVGAIGAEDWWVAGVLAVASLLFGLATYLNSEST